MAKSIAIARTNEALKLLLDGRSAAAIVSLMSERHGVTRRQGQRYVAAAYEIIRLDIENSSIDRQRQAAKLIHLLEEGAAVALATKNIGALVGSCKEIRELCGLTANGRRI
jgi:hypothetical protein